MSFTTDVCEELLSLHTDKNCCKKALLCGLLFCAKAEPDTVCSVFKTARAAESAMFLLETRYASDASVEEISRAGRKYYKVAAECHSLADIIRSLDGEDTRPLWELLNFKCGNCRAHFLRGGGFFRRLSQQIGKHPGASLHQMPDAALPEQKSRRRGKEHEDAQLALSRAETQREKPEQRAETKQKIAKHGA